MTICIYLRPAPEIESLAERYAADLATLVPASMVLGPSALAHITLVHLDGVDDRADEIWAAATEVLDPIYGVDGPFYLSAIPFPDRSEHNYVRLEVSRSAAFEQAQRDLLALAGRFRANVTNFAGPAWRPHVTLAVVDRLPPAIPPFPAALGDDPWTATPALGRIGAWRHVDQLLHPAAT